MSKKWVDVDKISSIADRSKKYTDDKIADLAGTTLDAISDLEDGKQDTIFGSEGRDLVFNRDGELVAPPMRPNDNLIPYTNFANPDDFYANWTRSSTSITIEENKYVLFAADGEISIVLSKDVVKVLRNTRCIFSIVGTGTIDAVVSCDNTKTNGQTVLTPYIHIYDLEVPNPKTELVYSTGNIDTDVTGEVTSLTVEISAKVGARLYGVKLELGQIQTLAVDNLSGGYDIIPQYPARVLSTDYGDKYITIPKIDEDSTSGKGINNVVTYDKEGNTQFQHVTPNKNWLRDSIFCEMPIGTEWPSSWTRDPETLHFGGSNGVTGYNVYVAFANTGGIISTDIPLSELPIVANIITISAFGDGAFTLSAHLIQNGSDELINIDDTYGNLGTSIASPQVPSNKYNPTVISLTGHINIQHLDLSQYSLRISVNGYDGGSEYASTSLYGVKLEAGYHQTLAFLRQATPTYSVMTVIPQFPDNVGSGESADISGLLTNPVITGQNIFPFIKTTELIPISLNSSNSSYDYFGWHSTTPLNFYDNRGQAYRSSISIKIAESGKTAEIYAIVQRAQIANNINSGWLSNSPITVSCVVKAVGATVAYSAGYNSDATTYVETVSKTNASSLTNVSNLITVTFSMTSPYTITPIKFNITSTAANAEFIIYDFKVEFGTKSTLVYDDSSELYPYDLPGCSPEQLLAHGPHKSHTNLIRNGLLQGKYLLNSNGKTVYERTSEGVINVFDYWWMRTSNKGKLTIYDSCIEVESETGLVSLATRLDMMIFSYTYFFTFSTYINISNAGIIEFLIRIRSSTGVLISETYLTTKKVINGWLVTSFKMPPMTSSTDYYEFEMRIYGTVYINHAKLEPGVGSTALSYLRDTDFQVFDEYDFGAITIPQGQHMTVGYNENGRLVPVTVSPRPNLLINYDFSHYSRVLINSAYLTAETTITYSQSINHSLYGNTLYLAPNATGNATISFKDGYALITNASNYIFYISQSLTNHKHYNIENTFITASICYIDNNIYKIICKTIIPPFSITSSTEYTSFMYDAIDFYFTVAFKTDDAKFQLEIKPGKTVKIVSCKTELGNTQTLGYIKDNKPILFDKWEPIVVSDSTLAADVSTQSTEISALKTKTDATNTNVTSLIARVTALENAASASAPPPKVSWKLYPVGDEPIIGFGYISSSTVSYIKIPANVDIGNQTRYKPTSKEYVKFSNTTVGYKFYIYGNNIFKYTTIGTNGILGTLVGIDRSGITIKLDIGGSPDNASIILAMNGGTLTGNEYLYISA